MAKYCIDAGHGGKDVGAVGNGLYERNLNLTVALKVEELLKAKGHEVVMTRRNNETELSLSQRASISNKNNCNYFVSIHHNAGGGEGFEIIHSVVGGKSKEMAIAIAEKFKGLGQLARRTTGYYSRALDNGKDYYGVIRDTKAPAIITEYGFIDNSKDVVKFNTTAKLHKQAEAIVKGLLSMVEGEKPKQEAKKVVKTQAKKEEKVKHVQVTTSSLNVRAGKGVTFGVIGVIKKGEKYKYGTQVGNWVNIYYGSHGGWVNANYVKII